MAQTYYFYDLETSGLNSRLDRVMQFAGIRTDKDLRLIGEPHNVLVTLADDVLPSPDAVMVTGITPQATLADGITEREFCQLLLKEVFIPETITVGFNNVRFDDEFIRHTLWRNFYDPYEWAWADGRSRWDLLDVVRMTRALRPDGINWPVTDEGKPTNRLELLTKLNGLSHEKAHDALSDVEGLIAVAKLIKDKQPKLFEYLLSIRDKKKVAELVNLSDPQPFVYTSGRYGTDHEFTTVALPLCDGSKPGSVVVYDLRVDPHQFASLSSEAIEKALFKRDYNDKAALRLPLKELSYNRAPAVAPMGVLDAAAQQRLGIDLQAVQAHMATLKQQKDFLYKIREAFKNREAYPASTDVEAALYDGFVSGKDQARIAAVRSANADEIADFHPEFIDERLPELLLRYKARQFPMSLSEDERASWEEYRAQKLESRIGTYLTDLQRLSTSGADSYLLQELQLWAEAIMPSSDL